MAKSDTPRSSDDRETAAHKSRSVDERIPDHPEGSLADPIVQLPGGFGTNVRQAGVAPGALDGADLGPGEAALDIERKAQRALTQRG